MAIHTKTFSAGLAVFMAACSADIPQRPLAFKPNVTLEAMSDDINACEREYSSRKFVWRDATVQEYVRGCLMEKGYERVTVSGSYGLPVEKGWDCFQWNPILRPEKYAVSDDCKDGMLSTALKYRERYLERRPVQ